MFPTAATKWYKNIHAQLVHRWDFDVSTFGIPWLFVKTMEQSTTRTLMILIDIDMCMNMLKGWSNQRNSFVRHTLSNCHGYMLHKRIMHSFRSSLFAHNISNGMQAIHFSSAFIHMGMCDDYFQTEATMMKNACWIERQNFLSENGNINSVSLSLYSIPSTRDYFGC